MVAVPDFLVGEDAVDMFQGLVLGVVPGAGDVAFLGIVACLFEREVGDVCFPCSSRSVDEQVL